MFHFLRRLFRRSSPAPAITCPACDSIILPAWNYCEQCGCPLHDMESIILMPEAIA